MSSYRDGILIGIAALLLLAIFLPVGESNRVGDAGSTEGPGPTNPLMPAAESPTSAAEKPLTDVDPPDFSTSHALLPLIAGSEWRYVVTGPSELVPNPLWVLRVHTAPTADTPGSLETGWGTGRDVREVRLQDGALLVDGLPFVSPLRFPGNRPVEMSGAFLPPDERVTTGAVWTAVYRRMLSIRTRDERENIIDESVVGIQRDMAMVTGEEKVIVPAGIFEKAWRVEFTGRMEMEAPARNKGGQKRILLDAFTATPFRTDIIWFVPGIGIAKRRISYSEAGRKISVVFDLIGYRRHSTGTPDKAL